MSGDTKSYLTYGLNSQSDIRASDISKEGLDTSFVVTFKNSAIGNITISAPGNHNVLNALAAIAVAHLMGVSDDSIRKSLFLFQGVRRRFDVRVRHERHVYIDDYAHHPSELQAAITSTREMFPGKKITGIFQPHLFTRTRDFAEGFATSLALLDRVILLPIYPAREEPIPGITSEIILQKIPKKEKEMMAKGEVAAAIAKDPPEVLMTLGAGDIDRLVGPLEEIYRELE
jgi:UDP-N-acetylmuramate--alanine ligase